MSSKSSESSKPLYEQDHATRVARIEAAREKVRYLPDEHHVSMALQESVNAVMSIVKQLGDFSKDVGIAHDKKKSGKIARLEKKVEELKAVVAGKAALEEEKAAFLLEKEAFEKVKASLGDAAALKAAFAAVAALTAGLEEVTALKAGLEAQVAAQRAGFEGVLAAQRAGFEEELKEKEAALQEVKVALEDAERTKRDAPTAGAALPRRQLIP
eukprot:CAMPEP_0177777720 /NCGR_PEP_ID=MMETSP0491_2-20121128/15540_1 /TAXON_ID=63592 /ORGANISM="Tetraselmis chuii, Strain PLY429" /LENGTH=212 /DNA_ID=CAMNT_0019296883 /DNA_START=122 /DNA_END=760 /DNA_ORIENTATION=-